jgi:hypothetical protein
MIKQLFMVALCGVIAVGYYKKETITTYAYGAYLKYWRLPSLKEDILECLKTGKPLSDYSQETIKLAIKKSPDFLAVYLKDRLTPEQAARAVQLLRDFVDPQFLYTLCKDTIQGTVSTVRECMRSAADAAKKGFKEGVKALLA